MPGMKIDREQIAAIIALLVGVLFVERISETLGRSLDSLPVRIAAILIILCSVYFDRVVSLAIFFFIVAIYIQHHHNDLIGVSKPLSMDPYEIPKATVDLKRGGYTGDAGDEPEMVDYMPQKGDNDNEFNPVGESHDEKGVIQTEMLGSKAQVLFQESMRNAEALIAGNSHGNDGANGN